MKIDEVEERELIPGTRVRFIHSDRMTVAHWLYRASSIQHRASRIGWAAELNCQP